MRQAFLVLAVSAAAFCLTLGGSQAWLHHQRATYLSVDQLVKHPYMGSQVLVDDNDRVLDALDEKASGLKLDGDLAALAAQIKPGKSCVRSTEQSHQVVVCLKGIRARGVPEELDFNVDDARTATVKDVQRLAAQAGVAEVQVTTGESPLIQLIDGSTVHSGYAPVSRQVAQSVQHNRLTTCKAVRARSKVTTCKQHSGGAV